MAASVAKGDIEFDGAVVFDGTVDYNGAQTFDAAVDFDSTVDLTGATVALPTAAMTGTAEFDGAVNFDGACDFDSTVNFDGASIIQQLRVLAADAALTIAATDANVELNITTGTTAATMTATASGHQFTVYAGVRSGGAYTFACTRGATTGTVTLDAVGEGATFQYDGTVWRLQILHGGATFA